MSKAIEQWHRLLESGNPAGLDELLADDVVFHSPVVHSPQRGKSLSKRYLAAAFQVLGNDSFRYVREIESETDAVLEFELEIEGVSINGVDLIRWDESGKITDFKVMIRPLKAIEMIHRRMGELLQQR